MTLYVGDTLMVRATARDPYTKKFLDPMPAECKVSFWAPGVDRKSAPASYGPYTMQRDVRTNHFMHYVQTDEWPPGTYIYEIRMIDVIKNREFGTFVLSD